MSIDDLQRHSQQRLNAAGETVDVAFIIHPPRHWWRRWEGKITYRIRPDSLAPFGTVWLEVAPLSFAWSSQSVVAKLEVRLADVLGFNDRIRVYRTPTPFLDQRRPNR